MLTKVRWWISYIAWWTWLRVTPECELKHFIIDSVVDYGKARRTDHD